MISAASPAPQLVPVLELRVRVGAPVDGEQTAHGQRRETALLGGELAALAGAATLGLAGLGGTVLPGGADQQLVRPDGTIEIDAQYLVETRAGALIAVRARGIRRPSPDGVYFRVALSFSSSAEEAAELTRSVFVADGVREADEVRHTVFLVG